MRLPTVCSLSLILLAVPCSFAAAGGITEKENQRLHRALQPFVVPPDLPHVELSSDAPAGNDADDRDGDGLSNGVEKRLGADPNNPDTDGDGLLDGWEVYGVNGIDLPGKGASPLHKDIFVEMDYMRRASAANGLGPNDAVLAGIKQIFADGPVSNPDGRDGVNLHLERGNEVPYAEVIDNEDEFVKIKAASFDPKRAPVYHYMIWANRYWDDNSSGYSFHVPGSDFVVTLGGWNDGNGGTDNEKIGTFAHELGHNLSLQHGGSDTVNFKPNHLSIMNLLLPDRRRAARRQACLRLPALPPAGAEGNVAPRKQGAGQERPAPRLHHEVLVDARQGSARAGAGSIDWDQNGRIDSRPRRRDLNDDGEIAVLAATPNEWSTLVFDSGTIGKKENIATLLNVARSQYRRMTGPELSPDMLRRIRQSQP